MVEHPLPTRSPATGVAQRRLAVALVASSFLFAGVTDPDSAHFPAWSPVWLSLHAAFGLVATALLVAGSRVTSPPRCMRLVAAILFVLGVVLIFALGGLLLWVAPLLLIAADLWSGPGLEDPTPWLLIFAVVTAVGCALIVSLSSTDAPSAWAAAVLLWPVPLLNYLQKRRRLVRQ